MSPAGLLGCSEVEARLRVLCKEMYPALARVYSPKVCILKFMVTIVSIAVYFLVSDRGGTRCGEVAG